MTATLRGELTRWATELGLFSEEVALALDGMCARLAVTVGPMSARPLASGGDPDGFDGLVTRGLYERLMLSEWLLASEMPEEFDRRAATGEHLFLELARRRPDAARTSVVLFDSTASQLGAPRVVQLALLVTLARRAAAGRAQFVWSLLDEPDARLCSTIDAKSVRELLAARRASRLRSESIDRWLTRTTQLYGRDAEVWLVGGPACAGRTRHVVTLEDTLEAAQAVRVQVSSRGAQPREMILEMPESRVAARIVRDPFSDTPPMRGASSARPTSNLVFSSNGVKLFARGAEHAALVIPVPNSPRAQFGKVRAMHARSFVLAAGVAGGKTYWLVRESNGEIYVRRDPARGGFPVGSFGPIDGEEPLAPLQFPGPRDQWLVLWKDSLLRLSPRRPEDDAPAAVVASGVLDLAPTQGGCDFSAEEASLAGATRKWPLVSYQPRSDVTVRYFSEEPPLRALIARTRRGYSGSLFAFTVDGSSWQVVAPNGRANLSPAGERVLGLVGTDIADAGFVMLDGGRRKIRITLTREDVTLVRAAVPIAHTAISSQGVLAWLTEDNELGFLSLVTRKILQQRRLGVRP